MLSLLTPADDLDHKNISWKQIQLPSKSAVGPNGPLRLLPERGHRH